MKLKLNAALLGQVLKEVALLKDRKTAGAAVALVAEAATALAGVHLSSGVQTAILGALVVLGTVDSMLQKKSAAKPNTPTPVKPA